eukprot:TRINITY_DN14393_c0_g1_i4.p2 TRINITY_DN14393_c0_g1~~TRINITY_DN14393_c0_g1_i4.p2  ORF type:complete len:193 (+),score=35.17 TRINITY_DN14393_c0_g1_i4:147-725(+)
MRKDDSCSVFLKLADDFGTSQPLMALSCRIRYVEKFLNVKRQLKVHLTAQEQKEVEDLMRAIEREQQESGATVEQRKKALEEFCSQSYGLTIKEYLGAKKVGKDHAIKFNLTGYYIELLYTCGELSPKWKERCTVSNELSIVLQRKRQIHHELSKSGNCALEVPCNETANNGDSFRESAAQVEHLQCVQKGS